MASLETVLRSRITAVEDRLGAACRRAGRARAEVTLVAVTKTTTIEIASLLPDCGILDLGESRPQELWRKAAALPKSIRWHLVGHLQRNKIERTLPLVHLIHSVDSLRLLQALDQESVSSGAGVPLLLEVNASQETSKHGFAPNELPNLADQLRALRNVRLLGLMTMAAFEDDPERCRPTFALLRGLRERLQAALGPTQRLENLSMGMSNDFEVAVEEGATLVRIGSALFEGLPSA
jgi:pyridoxal phosphate enzyme (YggS family)